MNDWPHTPDPCEWDPVNGRPALVTDERHADATVSLGGGLWHLCAKCAALREFDRFPVEQRKALPRGGAMSVVGPGFPVPRGGVERNAMRNNLTWYYSAAAPVAYRFSSGTAAVVLEGRSSLVLVQSNADLELYPAQNRRLVASYMSAPARDARSIPFGALVLWASRLAKESIYRDLGDPQRVLGAIYSRRFLRDSLGWLIQQRIHEDARIRVESVPVEAMTGEAGEGVYALRMSHLEHGPWRSLLMCHAPASLAGDDPLFGGEA